MVIRTGRRGKFLGCSKYPECDHTQPLESSGEGGELKEGAACPQCGKPLVARHGRRGPFVGCSGYPECTFTQSATGAKREPPQKTDILCECGQPMVVRSSRRGKFLGCSAYPRCRNTKPLPAELESGPKDAEPTPP
jgi:DNA topoisomerase-1